MSLVSREVLNRDRLLANFAYLDYTDRDISTERTERKNMSYPAVKVKKGEARQFKSGGLWIYDNEIDTILEFIESCNPKGMVFGLDKIRNLLARVGNPDKKLKFIHIAGTNGKGSVGAYLSSVLVQSGYKIGRYVSPTIIDYCERIQIQDENGCRYISKDSICKKTEQIKNAIMKMKEENLEMPTAFEIETVIGFLEFLEQGCDYVVLEAGLGGREDATNIVENVELAILTSISKDHMGVLGDTVAQIAEQKSGIIKHGIDVVCYDFAYCEDGTEIEAVIQAACRNAEATYHKADFQKLSDIEYSLDGTSFRYKNHPYQITLLGENQPKNVALAIEAAECLKRKGYSITTEAIENGLNSTEWKGRFSVVNRKPLVIVDGAHNEDAARSLAKSLQLYFPNKKLTFIMGVFADKEYEKILELTTPFAKQVITIQSDNPRALPSDELAVVVSKYVNDVIDGKTAKQALDFLVKQCDTSQDSDEEVIVAFGSLSFLGEIYQYFQGKY